MVILHQETFLGPGEIWKMRLVILDMGLRTDLPKIFGFFRGSDNFVAVDDFIKGRTEMFIATWGDFYILFRLKYLSTRGSVGDWSEKDRELRNNTKDTVWQLDLMSWLRWRHMAIECGTGIISSIATWGHRHNDILCHPEEYT